MKLPPRGLTEIAENHLDDDGVSSPDGFRLIASRTDGHAAMYSNQMALTHFFSDGS